MDSKTTLPPFLHPFPRLVIGAAEARSGAFDRYQCESQASNIHEFFSWDKFLVTMQQKCQQVTRKVLRIKTHHKQHPSAAKASFCSVIGVPVCAALACWQVMSRSKESKVWSLQMDQIPAVPTGPAVGTNPPSLPTGDQRWEKTMRVLTAP